MKPIRKDEGFVYCLHDAENDICRIGKTVNNDMSRQKQQVAYYAFHLDITTLEVPNYTYCERFIHKALSQYRKKADWFKITPEMFKEQVKYSIDDFTEKYEKFKAIEDSEGFRKRKEQFENAYTPPVTNYRPRYHCAYCEKSLCSLDKIKDHMEICLENPKNVDACKDCKHCRTIFKSVKDEHGNRLANLYGFRCAKNDQNMYSHKAQAWGLNKKYPNSYKGEVLMPSTCPDFEDRAIIEVTGRPVKKKPEVEYIPRLDWDAYDRIEITKTP